MSNQQNNQKLSVILLAVAALLFSINFAGAADNDLPAKAPAPAKPILVFGSDQDYPPYEWLDKNGQPQGFNVDLIRAIGQAMGYEVTVRLGPWAGIREELEVHGTVDVADMFLTEQRAKRVDFAEPFWVVHDEIFVRQGEKKINSMDDLAGLEVLCQEGGSIYDLLRKDVPAAKLILVASDPEALRQLASGRHDCAVVGSVVGRYTINNSGLHNLIATGQPLWLRDYCFVTAKGRPQLLADLNLGLAILKETGRFDEIYDKWFKEYLPRKPWLDKFLKYLPWLAFGLAALAIAVAAWILTLRHQVRGRTQKLQRTLLLLNEAQSITKLGGWEYDAATRRVTWTDEVYRIYGVPKNYDPAQPEQNIQFYAPEDRARVTDAFRRAVEQGESYDLDLRLITAQGVKKWVRTIGRAERRGEKIVRVSGNIMDITDRKQASEDLKASNLELISARNQTEEALRTSERSRLALLSVLEDEKQTEQELRESEERFRALHNASFGGIAIHDKGKILECNQGLSEITGYSMEELIGMDGMLLINKDSRDLVMENILAGYEKPYEALGLRKNGETYPIRLEARNIPYKGKSVRTVEFRDITERKQAEEMILESNKKINILVNNLRGVAYRCQNDSDWTMEYISSGIYELTGYQADDFIGNSVRSYNSIIFEDDQPAIWAEIQKNIENKNVYTIEYRIRTQDGRQKWVWERGRGVFEGGSVVALEGFISDITDRKRAEQQIKDSLKEKEVLLKEIHHRVKNNLQIIASLLNLQTGYVTDEKYKRMFIESQNRVRSMALVHEKLYKSKDLAGIDFSEYVNGLMIDLYSSYGVTQGDVELSVDITIQKLPIDIAIPCGLLINELVSNSFKYAFKDKKGEGRLGISFKKDDAGTYALEVSDNGPGISAGLDLKKVPTLGLQLVDSLVGQLDASIRITGEGGTKVTIKFKIENQQNNI